MLICCDNYLLLLSSKHLNVCQAKLQPKHTLTADMLLSKDIFNEVHISIHVILIVAIQNLAILMFNGIYSYLGMNLLKHHSSPDWCLLDALNYNSQKFLGGMTNGNVMCLSKVSHISIDVFSLAV